MSLLSSAIRSVGRWLRRYVVDESDGTWYGGGGDTTATGRGLQGWLNTYETNSRLHTVIGSIAEDVACVDWHAYQRQSDGKLVELRQGPLVDWLEAPWCTNTGGTFFDLSMLISIWIDAVGEAFLLVLHNKNGSVRETVPIPPSWVSLTPADGVDFYAVACPTAVEEIPLEIPPKNMIWLRRPSAVNPYRRGRGRAQSLAEETVQEDLTSRFETNYFRNSARPDLVCFIEGLEDDPVSVKRLRAQWEEQHRGVGNAHKPAFLPAKGRLETVPVSLKEMAFIDLRNMHRDIIFQSFRVPPEILGVVENSNRATAEAALLIYEKKVILPRVKWLAGQFKRWLLPRFGDPSLVLGYDNPVQETQEFMLKKNIENFKAGLITRDEGRQNQGIDPLGGIRGEAISVPVNTVEMDPDGTFRSPPEVVDKISAPPDNMDDLQPENPQQANQQPPSTPPKKGNGKSK
jgi:HK97 family phage portal protein